MGGAADTHSMQSIESIYQSKLEAFHRAAQEGAARFGTDSGVFSDLLRTIEGRLSSAGAAPVSYTKKATSPEIDTAIEDAARQVGLDEDLIRAVIRAESDFDTDAVSHCGAMGLMQLMPGTAGYLGVKNPFDVRQNVLGGTRYLKEQLNRFGDLRLALAAYNAGPSKVSSLGITNPSDYTRLSPGVRGYVDKVLSYYEQYRSMRG